MKRLLSLSLIESSSRSKEGSGGQQLSPELLNKAFSTKSTQIVNAALHTFKSIIYS
jgi:hypothetical protein